MNLKNIIILLVFIFIVSIFSIDNEQFVPYQTLPNSIYKYWRTGSQPLNYYNLPIYRKPYRTPFKYYQSYPYPHRSTYPIL